MFKKIKEWVFPLPTARTYIKETKALAELELLKAQDYLNYYQGMVSYRKEQLERLINTQEIADGLISPVCNIDYARNPRDTNTI